MIGLTTSIWCVFRRRGPIGGLTTWRGLSGYVRAFRTVRRMVKERGIEHIHCGRLVPEGWIALLLNKLDGILFSCYVHGEDANAVSSGAADGVMSSRQLRWMTRMVMRSVSSIIANSRNGSASIAIAKTFNRL